VNKDPFSSKAVVAEEIRKPSLTVGEFYEKNRDHLDLGVPYSSRAMGRLVDKKRLQKLGMALAGFMDYLQPGRIYVFGNTEARFFQKQHPQIKADILTTLRSKKISCLLMTQRQEPPDELAEFARANEIALLRTQLDSSSAMYLFTEFLERELSPRLAIHGVLMDVYGVGALLVGESGVGKSECALELVLKGHRMVADDTVEIRSIGKKQLAGSAPPELQDVLELRGIGIVNIRELFGISAIRRTKDVNFIIELERWTPDKHYDRLGLDINTQPLMGFQVPYIVIPVAPGRNLATLVEVACRVYLMRNHGLHPMGTFIDFLKNSPASPPDAGDGEDEA
jgi:HPr kinase/phosphorylase